ncbi:glycosyl hydrolase family 18 protein [Phytohabitans sp. LJ34]|uniref:glycosyl hydrolase family 18 protein n=1 Tax=Phytohabitans sp. LJ34 TaxID=3452217 RepID=UPI003F8AF294
MDLDWEWPGSEGHPGNHVSPADKANNTALMAEFRRQLDALSVTTGKRYLLTAFTPADPAKIAAGWDIGPGGVFESMDFANVQGYDFHGAGSDNSWEPGRTGQSVSSYCYTGPGGQWWSFDDAWSIGQKTAWLKQKGLLGGMIWEMSGDTAGGTLMNALHTGL